MITDNACKHFALNTTFEYQTNNQLEVDQQENFFNIFPFIRRNKFRMDSSNGSQVSCEPCECTLFNLSLLRFDTYKQFVFQTKIDGYSFCLLEWWCCSYANEAIYESFNNLSCFNWSWYQTLSYFNVHNDARCVRNDPKTLRAHFLP